MSVGSIFTSIKDICIDILDVAHISFIFMRTNHNATGTSKGIGTDSNSTSSMFRLSIIGKRSFLSAPTNPCSRIIANANESHGLTLSNIRFYLGTFAIYNMLTFGRNFPIFLYSQTTHCNTTIFIVGYSIFQKII